MAELLEDERDEPDFVDMVVGGVVCGWARASVSEGV